MTKWQKYFNANKRIDKGSRAAFRVLSKPFGRLAAGQEKQQHLAFVSVVCRGKSRTF